MAFQNITNNFEGINTLKGLLNVPNLVTKGYAWVGLLFMMHIILLMGFLPFGFIPALLSSAFIMLITGMFLVYLNLISWSWLMFFLGEILIMILYVTWQERSR